MNEQENTIPNAPYLCLKSANKVEYFELKANSNSLIGSAGNCKIRLEGDQVRSQHCTLTMQEDGQLEVRDWNTGCTFFNGTPLSESALMNEGDRLQIGDYEITAVLSEGNSEQDMESQENEATNSEELANPEEQHLPIAVESVVSEELVATEEPVAEPEEFVVDSQEHTFEAEEFAVESTASVCEPEAYACETEEFATESEAPTYEPEEYAYEVEAPTAEAEASQEELSLETKSESADEYVYDIDSDFEDDHLDPSCGFAAPVFADENSADADKVQLLQMEVDQLRFELAQKHSVAEENSDLLSHDQTTLMVSRMEAMLSELAESDARSSEMEALLLAADQASKDEQEERKQIEAWVSKLENRVNQRETETESQVQQLKNLLQEARETQQKSNECLKSVLESKTSEGESVPMELANQLKKHVESLLSQLQAAQAESKGLREQLEQRSAQAVAESESEQKLAEMQLETSRERAEISRQRAELKRLEADLNARRGELSEVHGDEQAENASSLEDSEGGEDRLTSRIAELLPRVASE